jgi:hypothetical protein
VTALRKLGLVLGAALVIVTGGIGVLFLTEPGGEPMAPMELATGAVTEEQLSRAAGQRVFFAHMSVGDDILSGLQALYQARKTNAPGIDRFAVGDAPAAVEPGTLVHTAIGENGDPIGKLRHFDEAVRAGLGGSVDVAVLKFCYIDFDQDTDVDALFEEYLTTLNALERDYPKVTFLHATAPLTVGPSGVKQRLLGLLGRDDNRVREQYNTLMRGTFSSDRLFDIALLEHTATQAGPEALDRGYSSDGAHLNETGSAVVAAGLVRLLAAVGS